jgi:hypothetical protein
MRPLTPEQRKRRHAALLWWRAKPTMTPEDRIEYRDYMRRRLWDEPSQHLPPRGSPQERAAMKTVAAATHRALAAAKKRERFLSRLPLSDRRRDYLPSK